MAKKLGRLAGLAALGAAAYMMRDKFGKGKGSDDAGDQKTSSYTGDTKKVEVKNEPFKATNESSYTGTTKNTADAAKNIGFGGGDDSDKNLRRVEKPKSVAVTPSAVETKSLKPVSEPSDKSIKLAPENRDLETNMSRGTRTPAKPVSTVSSSAEGMKDYKPRRTPAAPSTAKSTVSSSAEGMKNYKPRSTPAAPAATTTKVAGTPTAKSKNMLEEAKEEARRRAAASQATRTSTSSLASPATRTPFPGSSALNKKKGGAVKMASGGMTASRRADGIASRGKTKCKMY